MTGLERHLLLLEKSKIERADQDPVGQGSYTKMRTGGEEKMFSDE